MNTTDYRSVRRPLGRTGLACCPLGFGGYRVTQGDNTHAAALRHYIALGGNLVDTSANYGLGSSELLVGQAVHEAQRDDLILVTKAGYVQQRDRMTAGKLPYPEIVRFSTDAWHCIHPRFLADQLEMSRSRLGVDKIDVYLLHNPEYYLTDSEQSGRAGTAAREEFYGRIRRAFEHLESEVARGRIRWYGMSSNTFGVPASEFRFVDLERCLEVARGLGRDHHFGVVQCPLNLLEPGVALESNLEGGTVLDVCGPSGLGVLINRPLNALSEGRLIRLADTAVRSQGGADAPRALAALQQQEQEFSVHFDFPLARGGIGVARWLGPALDRIDSIDAYRGIVRDTLVPVVETWLMNADRRLQEQPAYGDWRRGFGQRLDALIAGIQDRVAERLTAEAAAIRQRLADAGLDRPDTPLSRLALSTLLSTEGVSCVLNGMRSQAYVDDSMSALQLDPVAGREVLQRFADRDGT